MEEGSVAKVLSDFLTLVEGEISLKKGDIAQVLEKIDRHWWYGCCGGKYGKFPASHLIAVEVPPLEDSHELFAAIADFSPQQDGDLRLSRGNLVVGISQVNEDWWYGKIDGRTGIFPTTYTWQLDTKLLKTKLKPKVLNKRARVKMSMKAQLEEEMDLHLGDIVIVREIIDKNWYRGSCGTQEGVFPSAYVEILDDNTNTEVDVQNSSSFSHTKSNSDIDSLLDLSQDAPVDMNDNAPMTDSDIFDDDYFKLNMPSLYQTFNGTSEAKAAVVTQPLVELDVVPYGITLYPFYAQFDNELSFHEGEIVTLCRHIDKDWIEGKIDGKKGIFPKNYVNILVDCDSYSNFTEPPHTDNLGMELGPNSFAKVLYNFDAQMTGDLTVHKDEVVWIVSKVNGDWCEVKNQSGKVGLCPQNYLTPQLYSKDLKSEFSRGGSLVTDDLLNLFSTPEESTITTGYSGNLPNDVAISEYEHLSLSKIKPTVPQNKNINNGSVHMSHVSLRNSLDFSDKKSEANTMRYEQLPVPGLETQQVLPPQPLGLPVQDTRQQPIVEQDELELRKLSERNLPEPRFQRFELKRQSSDRIPHRPAPPVPVPGQKPVCRSLRRVPARSSSEPICEELIRKPPTEDEAMGGESKPKDQSCMNEEQRKKNAEQRQNVITELVYTEKEYVRDLKITYETFNLHNPGILEARGVDVKVVFGNILEVLHLAEELLDKLQIAMKGKDEEDQYIGPCFIELAEQMKSVYGYYCMNHNNALVLLQKYETIEEIQTIFNKGIETLRYQVACFDMGSILIKPVQRILKYPLILNELIKYTDDTHKDKPELLTAVRTMMDVATYINEYKRRQDIVSKYLGDENPTISEKMSRLSLHSVAKKSSRLGVMLTSTLFGVATKDPVFDEHEFVFHSTEKTVRNFVKNTDSFLHGIQEQFTSQLQISSSVDNFYQDRKSEVEDYHRLQYISKKFFEEFKTSVEKRVLEPLNMLIELFEGPAILVQKRHDKLLDYDGCCAKADKNKENRLIQEELLSTKSNYEALNSHLLEELPTLNNLASELLVECLAAFISARKMLSGKITKEYLRVMEMPLMKSCQGDPIETFPVKHTLVCNQLSRLKLPPRGGKIDLLATTHTPDQLQQPSPKILQSQNPSQQAYLSNRYPRDMLFTVTQPYRAADVLELSIDRGLIVGVIKKHDPLGDGRRWFVDNGTVKGFIPSNCLEPLYRNRNSSSPANVPSSRSPKLGSEISQKVQTIPRIANTRHASLQRDLSLPPSYDEVVSSESDQYYNIPLKHDSEEVDLPDAHGNYYSQVPRDSEDQNISDESSASVSVSSPGFYYAVYDFEGSGTNILTMKSGQILLVLQQQDCQGNAEWWLVEDRDGRKGYVPGNYLRKYQ